MPNINHPPCLLLCESKDCKKKKASDFKALTRRVKAAGIDSGAVKCQGSCVGPTAVLFEQGEPRWFENLGSTRAQDDLVEAAVRLGKGKSAKPSKRLRKRELTGKQRTRAAKRLQKQLVA